MAQEILFGAGGVQRGLGLGQIAHRAAARGPCGAHRAQVQRAERVQHRPMAARVQQAAVVVLAVQFHQNLGEGAQNLARDAAVIHPAGLAPVQCVHAAQDQFVIVKLDPRLGQDRAGGMGGGQVEHRRHFALARAAADQIGPPAPAKDKAQTIQQNRLARPRLAGQHVQAGAEAQVQTVDQQHVADVQRSQHVGASGAGAWHHSQRP